MFLNALRDWQDRREKQRFCLHHDRKTGQTWVRSQLLDAGARRMTVCNQCGQKWIA